MKKFFALAVAAVIFSLSLSAQDNKTTTSNNNSYRQEEYQRQTISSIPDYPRFEIVTSGIPGHKTYRIDKTDGTVWIFYGSSDFTVIERERTELDVQYPDGINYQLYVLGDGSNAYLVNLNTGIIWYYEVHLFKADRLALMRQR